MNFTAASERKRAENGRWRRANSMAQPTCTTPGSTGQPGKVAFEIRECGRDDEAKTQTILRALERFDLRQQDHVGLSQPVATSAPGSRR